MITIADCKYLKTLKRNETLRSKCGVRFNAIINESGHADSWDAINWHCKYPKTLKTSETPAVKNSTRDLLIINESNLSA
jgi:hypothetical protein